MKHMNSKSKYFRTKIKVYYAGVAFGALMCAASFSQAMMNPSSEDVEITTAVSLAPRYEPLSSEALQILIAQAKEGNRHAQDELIDKCYYGFLILNYKHLDFFSWNDIQERCYRDERYADYLMKQPCYSIKEIEEKFPALFEKVKERAMQNTPSAQCLLGKMYLTGCGVGGISPENDKLAFEWVAKAANQGNFKAQGFLGQIYLKGFGFGVGRCSPENQTLSFKCLKKAANKGNFMAQNFLGCLYIEGREVGGVSPENDKLGIECFIKAANQEFLESQFQLGMMYLNGHAVGGVSPENNKLAFEWMTKAANKEFLESQLLLSKMYLNGYGVGGVSPENNKLGIEWLTKAANQGFSDDQWALGLWYLEGRGVGGVSPDNDKLGLEWLIKAAQGRQHCLRELIKIYREGYGGIKKNNVEQLRWEMKAKPTMNNQTGNFFLSCQSHPELRTTCFQEKLTEIMTGKKFGISEGPTSGLAFLLHRFHLKVGSHQEGSNPFSIPDVGKKYKKIADKIETIFHTLESLKTAKPGFMFCPDFIAPALLNDMPFQKQPSFLSMDKIDESTYITLGEGNILLANKLVRCLSETFKKVDQKLKKINKSYKRALERSLGDLMIKQRLANIQNDKNYIHQEDESMPMVKEHFSSIVNRNRFSEEFFQQKQKVNQLEKYLRIPLKEIKEEYVILIQEKEKIKNLISHTVRNRNEEFLEEYPFFKK